MVSSPIRLVDNLHETTQLEGSSWAQGKTGHGLLLTSRMAIITCRKGMDLAGQMNMEMFSVKSHLQKRSKDDWTNQQVREIPRRSAISARGAPAFLNSGAAC